MVFFFHPDLSLLFLCAICGAVVSGSHTYSFQTASFFLPCHPLCMSTAPLKAESTGGKTAKNQDIVGWGFLIANTHKVLSSYTSCIYHQSELPAQTREGFAGSIQVTTIGRKAVRVTCVGNNI